MHACHGLSSEMGTICNIMCMTIISLKDCNKSMITVSSWLYKIKFGMMVQLIHQVYGRNKLDIQRRNGLGNEVNSLILEIHQLFVVFVRKVDTTRGHVQGQIWQQKQNSQETVTAKNKILDQLVSWSNRILYYSMVRR